MKWAWKIAGLTGTMAMAAAGQITNVRSEANAIRLEWTAMPGNPYRVLSTPDLVSPVWSNRTPAGLLFSESRGFHDIPAAETAEFFAVLPSEYLIVDLADGPEASAYPVSFTNIPPPGGWEDEYKTTKMVLRRIPAGPFTMGSPAPEVGHVEDEPEHGIRLTRDYYLGVFEVTQRQWERVLGAWPAWFTNAAARDARPVEQVSYADIRGTAAGTNWPADGGVDAESFLGRLREKTGLDFDLPTEAQWERACRAETGTALNSGADLTNQTADAALGEVGRYWYNGGAEGTADSDVTAGTAAVGSYLANAWGLHDLHGNVWEWCRDWYDSYSSETADPPGADSGSARVRRGGSWRSEAAECRSANRDIRAPDYRGAHVGFRIAQNLP